MKDDSSPHRKNQFDVLLKLVRSNDPWWVRLPFAALLVLGRVACAALAGGAVGKIATSLLRHVGRS